MTAPRVPPSTMMAAVTWVMSETLPPSSTSPPRMPPTATTRPPILAKSGRVDRSFEPVSGFVICHATEALGLARLNQAWRALR